MRWFTRSHDLPDCAQVLEVRVLYDRVIEVWLINDLAASYRDLGLARTYNALAPDAEKELTDYNDLMYSYAYSQ